MTNYTTIDDNVELSDQDQAKATALANKWSIIQSNKEQKRFRREFDEEYETDFDPYEDCECDVCMVELAEIGGPDCLTRKEDEARVAVEKATVEVEIEWIEEQLRLLGCRMMRPYEHWNEDEKLMEYSERER